MSRIERTLKNLIANCFRNFGKKNQKQKRFKGHCCQKCMEEMANIVRITNSTRITCCTKNDLSFFVIFPPEPLMVRSMTITYTIINRDKDRLFENVSQSI